MECEEGLITMKLYWHGYLVFSLGNCAMKLTIGLMLVSVEFHKEFHALNLVIWQRERIRKVSWDVPRVSL
jgi:non-homologous end joining protein Ku